MKKQGNKKLLALLAAAAIIIPATAYAATVNIDATANFKAAISLGAPTTMDFSIVEFSATPAAGTDLVNLGTNGVISYGGVFSGGTSGTAGAVSITAGTASQTVEIFCQTTATMSDGASSRINVTAMEVAVAGSEAASGGGTACAGIGTAATTYVLSGVPATDTFKFAGVIDGSTAVSFAAGAHSTALTGGNNLQVDIFYQ